MTTSAEPEVIPVALLSEEVDAPDLVDIFVRGGVVPDIDTPSLPWSGCHTLLWAILQDAFSVVEAAARRKKGARSEAIKRQAEDDRVWIFSKDEAPGSFLWICNALSLRPSAVRAQYRELLQGKNHCVKRHRKLRALAA